MREDAGIESGPGAIRPIDHRLSRQILNLENGDRYPVGRPYAAVAQRRGNQFKPGQVSVQVGPAAPVCPRLGVFQGRRMTMTNHPNRKQPSKRDRFIETLKPLVAKGATANELYDLVYRATSAQHAGELTWRDAQEIIYPMCGESLPE